MTNILQVNPSRLQFSSISMSCQLADHQGSEIKYFCCCEDCMQPLCPECIQNHSEYHERKNKVAILKNFSEVRTHNHQKILNHIDIVQDDLEKLEAFLKIDVVRETTALNSIREFRDTLLKSINEFFIQLERDFVSQMTEDYSVKSEKVDRMTREIKIYLDQLKEYETSLESENCTKVIARVHRRDLGKEYEHIKSKLSKDEAALDEYVLDIDNELIKRITDDLSRSLYLHKQGQYKQEMQLRPKIVESQVLYMSQRVSYDSPSSKAESQGKLFELAESGTFSRSPNNLVDMVVSQTNMRRSSLNERNITIHSKNETSLHISRPPTGQSSVYPEYKCSPKAMIKDFFSSDVKNVNKQDRTSINTVASKKPSEGNGFKIAEDDDLDVRSQGSINTEEYGSDFEDNYEEEEVDELDEEINVQSL